MITRRRWWGGSSDGGGFSQVTDATAATLASAIAAAAAGDIIDLGGTTGAPGTLPARGFSPPITVRNGTLDGVQATGLAGVTFQAVTFRAAATFTPVRFTGCARLLFVDGTFVGLGSGPTDQLIPTLLRLDDCAGVAVSGGDVSRGRFGVHCVDCDDVTIVGVLFHDMREDGVQATGARGLSIVTNTFRDFYGAGEIGTTGDHSDRIQITSGGGSRSSANITIIGNTMLISAGRVSQGIYVADEGNALGPPQGVTITGNVVESGMANGILVASGIGVVCNDNTVYSSGGASFLRIADNVGLNELLRNAANFDLPTGYTADPSNVGPPN